MKIYLDIISKETAEGHVGGSWMSLMYLPGGKYMRLKCGEVYQNPGQMIKVPALERGLW